MNRSEFVAIIAPIAQKLWGDGSGALYPSIRLAQTILETGGTIHSWNNIVGYKVGSGVHTAYWKGRSVNTKTWEVYNGVTHTNVTANWRAYSSIEDCLRDQDLLFQLDRYKDVREAKTPEDQAVALYRCGYATDGDYYKKLIAISQPYKYLDTEKGNPESKEGKPLQLKDDWQWKQLGDALDGLYKKGVISDWTWAEKAYKRTLTPDEVAWLSVIMFARSQGVEV